MSATTRARAWLWPLTLKVFTNGLDIGEIADGANAGQGGCALGEDLLGNILDAPGSDGVDAVHRLLHGDGAAPQDLLAGQLPSPCRGAFQRHQQASADLVAHA